MVRKNGNFIRTWWFLTVRFALPLCWNECKWVAAMTAQKPICGHQYHRPRARNKSSKLIEKIVRKNCNIIKTWCFLTVLFMLPLCWNERGWVAAMAAQKMVCGLQYHRAHVRNKSSKLIEKMASKKTVTSSKLDVFSPFFLCCRSSEMNASGWRQWWCKKRSVGLNTTERA